MNLSASTVASLFVAGICCACAPLPMSIYVADAPKSNLVYSSCSFNTHVPMAVRLTAGPVLATLSLSKHDGRPYVQLQLDVPEGVTWVFDDDTVQITTANPVTMSHARFPSVSLVDAPILNSYSSVAAAQSRQVPVRSPLVGGRLQIGATTSDRHFWLAAYVDTASAKEVVVALPGFRVNGVSTTLAPVRFRAETVLAIALMNC
ncbi:MAG: hypothetical protein ABI564_08930 [Ideonella sp.]